MSLGRRALRLAITFLLGSATSKILVFALLPLYTRVLSPSEYGFYDLAVTVVTIAASILFLDIWVGTMRYMYRETDRSHQGTSVKAGLVILGTSVVIFVVGGVLVGLLLQIPYLALILGYGVTTNVKEFYGFVARGYGMNATYSASGAVNTIIVVSLNVVLLVVLNIGLEALFIAAIAGNVVQIAWLELRAHVVPTLWHFALDGATVRGLLRFCLPLGVNSVAYWLLTGVGKILVFDRMTLADNGYFGIGTRFAMLVVVLASVFTMVWQDIAFSRRGDSGAFYRRALSFYLGFVGFGCAVLILLLGVAFPVLVGEDFLPVLGLLPGFILVAGLGAYSTFLGNTFYALSATAPVLTTTLLGTLTTVGLSLVLIETWGIVGANVAAGAGFVVIIIGRLIALHRRIGAAPPLFSAATTIAASAIAVVVYSMNSVAVSLGVVLALLIAFVLLYRRDIRRMFQHGRVTG